MDLRHLGHGARGGAGRVRARGQGRGGGRLPPVRDSRRTATGATFARPRLTNVGVKLGPDPRPTAVGQRRRSWRGSSATWPGATRSGCPEASLLNLINAFNRLTLNPKASPARCARRCVRVPPAPVRRRFWQEGRRVLHSASGGAACWSSVLGSAARRDVSTIQRAALAGCWSRRSARCARDGGDPRTLQAATDEEVKSHHRRHRPDESRSFTRSRTSRSCAEIRSAILCSALQVEISSAST